MLHSVKRLHKLWAKSYIIQGQGHKLIALLRSGSDLSDNAFLTHLEEHKLHYVIALRQTPPLQRALVDARRVHRH
jgi:hypothetical protein